MPKLAQIGGQVTALDSSASALEANKAALTTGIANTGNITSTGTHEATGGFITTDDQGNRVLVTVLDLGGGSKMLQFTEL